MLCLTTDSDKISQAYRYPTSNASFISVLFVLLNPLAGMATDTSDSSDYVKCKKLILIITNMAI